MTVLLTSEPLVELLESPRIIDARYGVFFRLHPASIPSMLTGVKGIAIFGYTDGSFRVLCHEFRRNFEPEFFVTAVRGPRTQPKTSAARALIKHLRKQNYSVYEIKRRAQGTPRVCNVANIVAPFIGAPLSACRTTSPGATPSR